jgi:hypothetical protein
MPVLFEGSKARFQGAQHRHSYPRSFASFERVCDDVALTCDTSLAFSDVLIDLGQVLAFSHRLAKGPLRGSWRLRCCWRLRRTWLRRHRAVFRQFDEPCSPRPAAAVLDVARARSPCAVREHKGARSYVSP